MVLCHSVNTGSVVGKLKLYLRQKYLFELFELTDSEDAHTFRVENSRHCSCPSHLVILSLFYSFLGGSFGVSYLINKKVYQ